MLHIWYKTEGKGTASSVVLDAKATLDAIAVFEGPEHEAHIRVAHHDGSIYVDMCNEEWQAIKITAWEIVSDPPVKFIRTAEQIFQFSLWLASGIVA